MKKAVAMTASLLVAIAFAGAAIAAEPAAMPAGHPPIKAEEKKPAKKVKKAKKAKKAEKKEEAKPGATPATPATPAAPAGK